jgi:hypothetical protein
MMTAALRDERNWGELGPAMRALSSRHRAFVEFYLMEPATNGAGVRAARRAGYGMNSKPLVARQLAMRLLHDERILAAIAEEGRKITRAGGAEAAQALINLVRDPTHKDHARGIAMLLARTDPEIVRQDLNITHRIVDPDQESIEELAALRSLGTSHAKLVELFGANGIERIERLEAERRAVEAKVIEGVEYTEAPNA